MEIYLWIILAGNIVYTLATMCMKRSTNVGIGPWRTTVVWNAILALMALPLWFIGENSLSLESLLAPILMSFGFFLGQLGIELLTPQIRKNEQRCRNRYCEP